MGKYYLVNEEMYSWICDILHSNCLVEHVTAGKIEGGIEVTGRQGRRRKRLLDAIKETKGYWELKTEALDRILWRIYFGIGDGPVVRQTKE
jgi:hypothetical protein